MNTTPINNLRGIACMVSAGLFLVTTDAITKWLWQLAAIAPFRYIQIIWAILAGWLIWGEMPSSAVFNGIGIICASGIYIAWREALATGQLASKARQ